MKLGIESFLILGCIAVVILEMPHLIGDIESASVRTSSVNALLANRAVPAEQAIDVALDSAPTNALLASGEALAAVDVADLAELLPAQPGL